MKFRKYTAVLTVLLMLSIATFAFARISVQVGDLGAITGPAIWARFASLDAAVIAIGGADTTLIINYPLPVLANVTTPITLKLEFKAGGSLDRAPGTITTINSPGHIVASRRQQIFIGTGVTRWTERGTAQIHWWNDAAGDGATDSGPAFNAAIASNIGMLKLPAGRYYITTPIVAGYSPWIVGEAIPSTSNVTSPHSVYMDSVVDGNTFTFNGAAGINTGGAGGFRNIIFSQRSTSGNAHTAVSLDGADDQHRVTWFFFENCNFDRYTAISDYWTYGVHADGMTVGGADGLRHIYFSKGRISSDSTVGAGIYLDGIANVYIDSLQFHSGLVSIYMTGDAITKTGNVHISNSAGLVLYADHAISIRVIGGGWTTIETTANTSNSHFAPNYVGEVILGEGSSAFIGYHTTPSTTLALQARDYSFYVARDEDAGDSNNITALKIGNYGDDQGSASFSYENAAAVASPETAWRFIPRNNADAAEVLIGIISMTKDAGADTGQLEMDIDDVSVNHGTFRTFGLVTALAINGTFGPADGNIFDIDNTAGANIDFTPVGVFRTFHMVIVNERGGNDTVTFDPAGANVIIAANKMGLFFYNGGTWEGGQID
jgi:hypothetical protein